MKITTWNVNGLRAVLRKGALDWVRDWQPDILCLQEIKVRPEQVDVGSLGCLDGYQTFWNPALRPGYSGVATLTRYLPDTILYGTGEERFDSEGRLILTRHTAGGYPDLFLFNVYFPNGQRGHDRVRYKLEFYAHLLDLCDRLHADGKQIVICGDFNTAHREIDLKNPKANSNTSGFLPEERVWIDRYLEHGLRDAFRELYPQQIRYTWWTYIGGARQRNVGWRLDYFLVSDELLSRVQDVVVHDDILGSDHCPVTLVIG